jgi:hypothetical protein
VALQLSEVGLFCHILAGRTTSEEFVPCPAGLFVPFVNPRPGSFV